jgi:hypothetical protein
LQGQVLLGEKGFVECFKEVIIEKEHVNIHYTTVSKVLKQGLVKK